MDLRLSAVALLLIKPPRNFVQHARLRVVADHPVVHRIAPDQRHQFLPGNLGVTGLLAVVEKHQERNAAKD